MNKSLVVGVDRPDSGNGGVQWGGRSSVLTVRGVQRAQQPQECEAQGGRHTGLEWAREVPGGTASHPGILTSASQLLLNPHSPAIYSKMPSISTHSSPIPPLGRGEVLPAHRRQNTSSAVTCSVSHNGHKLWKDRAGWSRPGL